MRRLLTGYALAALPALFITVTFVFPVCYLVTYSLSGGKPGAFSLAAYLEIVTDSYDLTMIVRTIVLSLATTIVTLVLAFPVALYMRQVSPRMRALVGFVMLSPLLTSVVVRSLAWVVMLGPQGVVNNGLRSLGIAPVNLIYNDAAVILGLTHVFLGYMVLSLLASVLRLDENMLLAASNLGAGRWQVLRRVVLPQCLPGMLAGSTLVFTMSASSYATPALLAGNRHKMVGQEIADLAIGYLEWKEAAALSAVLFIVVTLLVWAITRAVERGRWKVLFQ
jgi:putative spermidine/putrescine transport system permease protein